LINKLLQKWPGISHNSCSIHIRRGDYINNPYGLILLPIEYYEKAFEKINNKTKPKTILIPSISSGVKP